MPLLTPNPTRPQIYPLLSQGAGRGPLIKTNANGLVRLIEFKIPPPPADGAPPTATQLVYDLQVAEPSPLPAAMAAALQRSAQPDPHLGALDAKLDAQLDEVERLAHRRDFLDALVYEEPAPPAATPAAAKAAKAAAAKAARAAAKAAAASPVPTEDDVAAAAAAAAAAPAAAEALNGGALNGGAADGAAGASGGGRKERSIEGFAEALLAAQRHAVEERLTDVELAWGPRAKRVFGADGDADGDPTAPLPAPAGASTEGKLREGAAAAFAKAHPKLPVALLKEAGFFGDK